MNEPVTPNLSLPEAAHLTPRPRGGRGLNILVVLLLAAVLGFEILAYLKPAAAPAPAALPEAADDWRDLAQKATQRNLHKAAAEAWSRHLDGVADREGRGKILYQRGCELLEGGEYEAAVVSFWQAERFLGAGHDLASQLTERIAECFERLGKYDEKDRELRERVGVGTERDAAAKIAAEIGLRKIALHDLDAKIGREVDLQLKWLLALSPDMEAQARKQLLAPYADPQRKLGKLYELVGQQLLYRRGRELKMDQDPELGELVAQMREQVVASAVLAQELRDKIKPTEVDLRAYFQANADKFQTPPRATVRILPVADEGAGGKIIAQAKTEADFTAAATVDGKDQSILAENISPQDPLPQLGQVHELAQAIFAAAKPGAGEKPVEAGGAWFVFFVRAIEPPRQPDFAAVQGQVLNAYVQEKQRELKQVFIQELFKTYGAIVHDDVVLGKVAKEQDAGTGSGKP